MTLDTKVAQFSVAQLTVSATVTYYNPATGAFQATAPTINRNAQLMVRVRVSNNSGYAHYIRPEVRFKKPDATILHVAGFTNKVATGSYTEQDFFTTADQAGTWQCWLWVYVGYYQDAMNLTISEGWFTAATVVAVAMGAITKVEYLNPDTGAWGTSVPVCIVGMTLEARAYGRNDSGIPMAARMDLEVKDPDNVTTKQTGPVLDLAATGTLSSGYWGFYIDLKKAGTWSLTFKLYGTV